MHRGSKSSILAFPSVWRQVLDARDGRFPGSFANIDPREFNLPSSRLPSSFLPPSPLVVVANMPNTAALNPAYAAAFKLRAHLVPGAPFPEDRLTELVSCRRRLSPTLLTVAQIALREELRPLWLDMLEAGDLADLIALLDAARVQSQQGPSVLATPSLPSGAPTDDTATVEPPPAVPVSPRVPIRRLEMYVAVPPPSFRLTRPDGRFYRPVPPVSSPAGDPEAEPSAPSKPSVSLHPRPLSWSLGLTTSFVP